MKRISTFSILLMLVAMMVAFAPSVLAQTAPTEPIPSVCPAGTHHVIPGDDTSPCVADEPTAEPTADPTAEPCISGEPCIPTDPCSNNFSRIECPVEVPVVTTPAPQEPEQQEGISFNDSDLGVSLYVGEDANGAPVLEIYETANQTTTGNFAVTVTQDDLAQFVNALPSENVLLKSAGHVRVFVLTTGEIAVFVGPDSEGKVHVKVFDGIPWSHVYGFTIDPV